MKFATIVICGAAGLALNACGPRPQETADTTPPPQSSAPEPVASIQQAPPPRERSTNPVARQIDEAVFAQTSATPQAKRDMMIRAQVLLDRAHFSPGVIDGQSGGNMTNAIRAFEAANDLPEDGALDADVWSKLTTDSGPILVDYRITEADAKGPYTAQIPDDLQAMSKLDRLGYSGPLEALAERFHMDQDLLKTLNPDADFGAAGTTILVAAPDTGPLSAKVRTVEVDKAGNQVRAYDAAGKLLAAYPATVGSSDLPTPSGEWAVRTIAPAPTWTYDPSRLSFGDKSGGKATIAAGPNNPVGSVWIDLTKDTYGIHGSPDPKLIGKTASHGCVRLTNWDAEQLSKAVSQGTKVVFVDDVKSKKT